MNIKEILRYLGYGHNKPDDATLRMIEECYIELSNVAQPKYVAKRVSLTVSKGGDIELGDVTIHSKDLAKNLLGCNKAIVFAATLGIGTDMLMNRYVKLDISRASVLQACGAAMIEEYIDEYMMGLAKELSLAISGGTDFHAKTKPHISIGTGYGDLKIPYSVLEGIKNLG